MGIITAYEVSFGRDEFNPSDPEGINTSFELIKKDLRQTGKPGALGGPRPRSRSTFSKAATTAERFRPPSAMSHREQCSDDRPFLVHRLPFVIPSIGGLATFCRTFASNPAAHSFRYRPYKPKWKPQQRSDRSLLFRLMSEDELTNDEPTSTLG